MSKKRGQLSLEEEKFIRDNFISKTVEEISILLNRSTNPIQRYIDENNLLASDSNNEQENNYLKHKLHKKTFWQEVTRQFDADSGELKYFEDTWVGLIKQFREDVLPAEELQIKQFITIDILINRSMKERKRHITDTEKLQRLVDKEYSKPEDQRDPSYLLNLETQLSFARNSIASYTNEFTKLLGEQQKISKDLKATREQRIKRIEDGKSSWAGLIRMLEDEQIREAEGRQMEIINISTNKVKLELMEYHQYQDNSVDIPLLTPESVLSKEN
jgi:hypothetical protein